jgi:probable HAF family extracellular repeat protein
MRSFEGCSSALGTDPRQARIGGKEMKGGTAFLIAVILFALAQPNELRAQHPRYRLVDLGTLGGPHSYGEINGDGIPLLNNSGIVGSFADTTAADPNAPNCAVPDCFLAHAFRWKNGVMTDIGALPGVNFSAAGSTNARGWMAGQSSSSTIDPNFAVQEGRAVLWKNDGIVDLGDLPGGTESLSVYVNDSGQVVGFSDNGVPDANSLFFFPTGTQIRTFVWENGTMRDIGTLGGASAVPGVNCSGQPRNVVVGASFVNNDPNSATGVPTVDPFLWKDGVMTDLGSLGGTIGFGHCPNHRGQIIGNSNLSGDVNFHAFLWENGAMSDLGTLGGRNSEAIWINDAGMIVGSADLAAADIHDAVIWKNGKMQDLGTVDGDACSRGRGLNGRGQVVGGSSDCRNFLHAFVWEEGGPMLDLNKLIAPGSGWQVTNAFNINDRGEILAKAAPLGFTPNDDADLGHLVLLVPCEEDETDCAASGQATTGIAPQRSKQVLPRAAGTDSTPHPRTAKENVAVWHARFAKQYHAAGIGTGKR